MVARLPHTTENGTRVAIDMRGATDHDAPLLVHIVAKQLVGGLRRDVIVRHEREGPAPNNVLADRVVGAEISDARRVTLCDWIVKTRGNEDKK